MTNVMQPGVSSLGCTKGLSLDIEAASTGGLSHSVPEEKHKRRFEETSVQSQSEELCEQSNFEIKKKDVEEGQRTSFLDMGYLLTLISQQLSYGDIINLMRVNREFRSEVNQMVSRYTVGGLDPKMNEGILRIVSRYSTPAGGLSQDRERDITDVKLPTFTDVVKALGWRDYSSKLKLDGRDPANTLTLTTFMLKALEHYHDTVLLRDPEPYFPRLDYHAGGTSANYVPDQQLMLQLVSYWKGLVSESNRGKKANHLDEVAKEIMEKLGLLKDGKPIEGHNVSFALDRDISGRVIPTWYSNNPISGAIIPDESRYVDPTQRSNWPPELRSLRRGSYPLPIHSEMQRTLHLEPWQLGRCGNIYPACPQCSAGYFAMGVTDFRGSHPNKAASVIPPKIRGNSVYLKHYLGPNVWGSIIAMLKRGDFNGVVRILDLIERMTTTVYNAFNDLLRSSQTSLQGLPAPLPSQRPPALLPPQRPPALLPPQRPPALLPSQRPPVAPKCPKCGNKMVERRSIYGPFWGCGNFPRCDGKRKV